MKRQDIRSSANRLILTSATLALVVVPHSPGSVISAARHQKPAYQPSGAEGSVSGSILFEGARPVRTHVDMSADARCPGSGKTQDLIVTNGMLANVLVYLRGKKVDDLAFESPNTPKEIDQTGCQFTPRVVGIQTGQVLRVLNSDPTTHNVHPAPRINLEWNRSQPPGAEALQQTFNKPEVAIPIKCNQHPWMRAWVGVFEHPFFAVSEVDGSYTISSVPPGEYEIVAWHETLGEQKAALSIGQAKTVTIDFRFRRRTASNSPR